MKKFSSLTGCAGLLTALALVCALVFAGCDNSGCSNSNEGGSSDTSVTYTSKAADGKDITVTVTQKGAAQNLRAAYEPQTGDTYTMTYEGAVVSTGTVEVTEKVITFTSATGKIFSGTITGTESDAALTLVFAAHIPTDSDDTPTSQVTLPVEKLPLAGTVAISGHRKGGADPDGGCERHH